MNADRHRMFYEAGVEEFLSLVKNAEYVITNSYHGMIFSVQFNNPFVIFSREQCNTKISELLEIFGLQDRLLVSGNEKFNELIDYEKVNNRIELERNKSQNFLRTELEMI